jgi:hypothetical protein
MNRVKFPLPAFRRFFGRIFSRKFILGVAFCALTLAAVIAVAYCVEKWRGQRAWDAYAELARQRGVKLWPEEFAQQEIPDADNYAAVPCIREIETTTAENRGLVRGLPDLRDANGLDSFSFHMAATRSSVVEARDFFVKNMQLTNPSGDPAKDLVGFLATHAPALEQLREATRRRFCRFSTHWGRGTAVDRALVGFLQNAATLFRVSSSARLAMGDVAGAADEIRHLIRLSEAIRSEPGLLASIIGAWSLEHVASAISDGLFTGQWTDSDLHAFEQQLASFSPIDDFAFGLNSERAFANVEYERIAQRGYVSPFPNQKDAPMMKVKLALYPSGWVRQNMVKTNEYFDFFIEQLEAAKVGGHPEISPKQWNEAWSKRNLGKSMLARAYWAFTSSLVYLMSGNEISYTSAHSHLAQTRLACALERYHRSKGGYPEKLESLVPEFLPFIPQPLVADLRIHYAPEKNGYVLWETVTMSQSEAGADVSDHSLGAASWVWRRSGL